MIMQIFSSVGYLGGRNNKVSKVLFIVVLFCTPSILGFALKGEGVHGPSSFVTKLYRCGQ